MFFYFNTCRKLSIIRHYTWFFSMAQILVLQKKYFQFCLELYIYILLMYLWHKCVNVRLSYRFRDSLLWMLSSLLKQSFSIRYFFQKNSLFSSMAEKLSGIHLHLPVSPVSSRSLLTADPSWITDNSGKVFQECYYSSFEMYPYNIVKGSLSVT